MRAGFGAFTLVPPAGAVGLAALAFALAILLGLLAPPMLAPQVTAAVAGVFYFGWPYLVTRELATAGMATPSVSRTSAIASFLAEASTIALAATSPVSQSALVVALNLAGLMAAILLFYLAAAALVEAEDGKRPPVGRCLGTFLLFFFLPFGIWTLQKRLRAVASSRPIGGSDIGH